jgi:hypothetical protein
MARFVVQRNLGEVQKTELETAARRSKQVREERFPDITWEHSHVVKGDGGLVTYCIYGAPSVDRVREHARAAGLPADAVFEIVTDVDPAQL